MQFLGIEKHKKKIAQIFFLFSKNLSVWISKSMYCCFPSGASF